MSYATAYRSVQQYAAVGVEASVTDAKPHYLIQLLLDGVLGRIAAAKGHMQRGDVAQKGECIGQAIGIVSGLRASLNRERGGEIAGNLEALYDYAELRLLQANVQNELAYLDEVSKLLGEIKGAWDSISTTSSR